MPTSSNKLLRCKKAFDSWRKDSLTKRGKRIIPERLWKQAIELIADYSISRVAQELRLNQARLRQKQTELNSDSLFDNKTISLDKTSNRDGRETESNQFVRLDAPLQLQTQHHSFDLKIVAEKVDQTRLELSLSASQQQLAEKLFQLFLHS